MEGRTRFGRFAGTTCREHRDELGLVFGEDRGGRRDQLRGRLRSVGVAHIALALGNAWSFGIS
jgi:hypothetical protein